MKICTKCKVEKRLNEFYMRKAAPWFSSACKCCVKEAATVWGKEHEEKHNAVISTWQKEHREKRNASCKKWRDKDLLKERARTKAYKEKNREKVLAKQRETRRNNLAQDAAKTTRRKAAKLQATPTWANDFFVEEAYDLAARRTKTLGFRWEVDHIVPLQSKLVCGLHNEFNLQVISKTDNASKGNRYWPDMP